MPLFGKKKPEATPAQSIEKLRETLQLLEKREKYLQQKCDQQTAEAKKFLGQKNKRAALMCLKKKKTYEGQIEKLNGAMMTIETQVMTLENANVNVEAMAAMKSGANAMKGIHKNLDINAVDNTMDDIREQMDLANEISDAISQPLGNDILDEDELLEQLAEMEQEELESTLLGTGPVPAKTPATGTSMSLPSAPTAQLDEDAELAALEASMT